MAVELDGNVRMRGDTGPGVGVRVLAERGRLRLVAGNELVGDWSVSDIGVRAQQEGFNIKAEGEEFTLRTGDDVALALELGVTAASSRLARLVTARNNPEETDLYEEPPQISSNLAAIAFAVAGALVILGGTFLNIGEEATPTTLSAEGVGIGEFDFWLAFVIGGVLMIGVAYVMSIGTPLARLIATVVLLGLVVVFGIAVSQSDGGTSQVTAYGFIAGGLVVGVAVVFSGSLGETD